MSRIGKAPIPVPSGVEVTIDGRRVAVKGPKGELDLEVPGEITVRQDGEELVVERLDRRADRQRLRGRGGPRVTPGPPRLVDGQLTITTKNDSPF